MSAEVSTERFDVVVVGVGGMGSAALYHLARRGQRVLGLERFDVLHDQGSSHGLTRIIRLAYFEHPDYVPLLRRAYELWRDLEAEAGEQLLHVTGIVEGGEAIAEGVLRSCAEHDLPHEVLSGREVAARFPAYRLPPDLEVVFQPEGGFVVPERCIVAHVSGALERGGELSARERVLEWEDTGGAIRVRTDRREVEAERLVLTAGAWSQDVARLPEGLVHGVRQALAWFQPSRPELFAPSRMPVFNLALDGEHFYGFPAHGIPGFKLGRYDHFGSGGDPDTISREPTLADEGAAARFRRALLPGRRRPHDRPQDMPLRALSGRALPGRQTPRERARGRRRGLLGTRVQVLLGDGRDPRRPRARRLDPTRHRPLPARSLRVARRILCTGKRAWRNWQTRRV